MLLQHPKPPPPADQLALFADLADPKASVFFKPFTTIPSAVPADVAGTLATEGEAAIQEWSVRFNRVISCKLTTNNWPIL